MCPKEEKGFWTPAPLVLVAIVGKQKMEAICCIATSNSRRKGVQANRFFSFPFFGTDPFSCWDKNEHLANPLGRKVRIAGTIQAEVPGMYFSVPQLWGDSHWAFF